MKQITCILYESGNGLALLESLHRRGLNRASLHHARGSVIGDDAEFDMELLTVVVDAAEAGEVFEFLYFEAGIDRPRGGFMYVASVRHSSPFVLPQVPEE